MHNKDSSLKVTTYLETSVMITESWLELQHYGQSANHLGDSSCIANIMSMMTKSPRHGFAIVVVLQSEQHVHNLE
jgi:hypothetical protein